MDTLETTASAGNSLPSSPQRRFLSANEIWISNGAADNKCDKNESRIMSIQSHVVRGYVGNRATVAALQMLGHETDFCNSVEFSSMYVHEGNRHTGEDLRHWWSGVKKSIKNAHLGGHPGASSEDVSTDTMEHDYQIIMSGFAADVCFLREIGKIVDETKAGRHIGCQCRTTSSKGGKHLANCNDLRSLLTNFGISNKALYICDPVLGDNGRLYVPQEISDEYKNSLLRIADIVLPNEYELQWLTGVNSDGAKSEMPLAEVFSRISTFHQSYKTPLVVVTSVHLSENSKFLYLVASMRNWNTGTSYLALIPLQKLDVYLGGCGDLFSAFLAHVLCKDSQQRMKDCDTVEDGDLLSRFLNVFQIVCGLMQMSMRIYVSSDSYSPDINIVRLRRQLVATGDMTIGDLLTTVTNHCKSTGLPVGLASAFNDVAYGQDTTKFFANLLQI